MLTSDFATPWHKSLAQELEFICTGNGFNIGRQHSIEIIAACFGTVAAGLFAADELVLEKPRLPNPIHWDYVQAKLKNLLPNEPHQVALAALCIIWEEEVDERIAGAKRLIRNVSTNCTYQEEAESTYSGSALLTDEDWQLCGNTAGEDDFVDGLFEPSLIPSIVSIARAREVRSFDDRYPVNHACVLNIAASLCRDFWQDILVRYQV